MSTSLRLSTLVVVSALFGIAMGQFPTDTNDFFSFLNQQRPPPPQTRIDNAYNYREPMYEGVPLSSLPVGLSPDEPENGEIHGLCATLKSMSADRFCCAGRDDACGIYFWSGDHMMSQMARKDEKFRAICYCDQACADPLPEPELPAEVLAEMRPVFGLGDCCRGFRPQNHCTGKQLDTGRGPF